MASSPLDRPVVDHWGRRVGFWLGLLLFAVILCLPTTERMRAAGRRVVRAAVERQLQVEQARQADEGAAGSVDEYLAARPVWFKQESERRARAIIPAAAVTALVACWWITVAVPLPVTKSPASVLNVKTPFVTLSTRSRLAGSSARRLMEPIRQVSGCAGMNVIVANGAEAYQDVFHLHIHLTPRRRGDGLPPGGL